MFFLLSLALALPVAARFHRSLIPEDLYAFPKFHVAFLNAFPLSNDTAQRWLSHGLQGGELEFMGHPWLPSFKEIDGSSQPSPRLQQQRPSTYRLEHMKIGPLYSYLCLIPPEPQSQDNAFQSTEDPPSEVTLLQSWALLQPLSGRCLYHRQGWFTYSYCHNAHVRQFREQPHSFPYPAGYKPKEDPEWESFTLGQAPNNPQAGADLTVAEQNALAVNLELARGAGKRYLVQRWGDGTVCDKTGRQREVEIQFHCSMTVTDTILFIKETTTCHYVLVIQTPRLCGDPVFRSRLESREESTIRCRQIIPSSEQIEQNNDPRVEATVPLHVQSREAERRTANPQPSKLPPGVSSGHKLTMQRILDYLREQKLGNVFSFPAEGGMLLQELNEDGSVVEAHTIEFELEGVDLFEGVTKGKQYPLTEDVLNSLWDDDEKEKEEENTPDAELDQTRPLDEL